jgi:predicted aminopeptidase
MLESFRAISRILLVVTLLPLSGCYLMQAAGGQMEIASKRQPIAAVVADSDTPATLRTRLEYVEAARDFASRELGLPDNDSYRSYADVGRQYVIWNVFATDEFSVEPRRWCFPIAGCVVYRGYFSEDAAESYARRLRLQGDDTSVGGVAAYSTLGHFKDPVLNTMLAWSDAQLAATLFHELAHQVAYVAGDSEFNEAFATVVEEAGVERWLVSRGRGPDLQAWRLQRARGSQFIALLLKTRDQLKALYASGLPPEQMRERKQYAFGELKLDYARLRNSWGGYRGYDHFFDRTLNNAHLVSAATYYGCVPGLQRLLQESDGDLPRFYERVRELTRLDAQARDIAVCRDPQPPAIVPVSRSGIPESSSPAGS